MGVQVQIGKPYTLPSEPGIDPVSGQPLSADRHAWFTITDSTGCARLSGFPEGERYVMVCSELYGRSWAQIVTALGRTDSLRFRLRYLGRPADGRRCEVVYDFDDFDDFDGLLPPKSRKP
jgi:hypothetical protein